MILSDPPMNQRSCYVPYLCNRLESRLLRFVHLREIPTSSTPARSTPASATTGRSPSRPQDPRTSVARHLSGVYTTSRLDPALLALADTRDRRYHAPPGPIGLRSPVTRFV